MRAIVVLSCMFAVSYGFNVKRLVLDLGRLEMRETKPDVVSSM